MQQKVVMRVSDDRQTVISSGRSHAAQIISNGLSGKTQIANPAPIIATIGKRHWIYAPDHLVALIAFVLALDHSHRVQERRRARTLFSAAFLV